MNDRLSILNIGGHPKDAILYAGGTMAKHVALGDRVCLMAAYNGMRTHLVAIDEFSESGKMPDWDAHVEDRKLELMSGPSFRGHLKLDTKRELTTAFLVLNMS